MTMRLCAYAAFGAVFHTDTPMQAVVDAGKEISIANICRRTGICNGA